MSELSFFIVIIAVINVIVNLILGITENKFYNDNIWLFIGISILIASISFIV